MRVGPFLFVALFLFLLWFSAFFMFHIAAAFLDLMLVLAVISIVAHFLTGKRTA